MATRIDLTGQRFGKWLILSYSHEKRNPSRSIHHYWNCVCECGVARTVAQGTLINGTSKSCGGCGSKSEGRKGHGMSGTPEYYVWAHMVQRCTNPNNQLWERYGGRGILVCDQWLKFEGFIADMGKRPKGKYSIERRDNDKGYSPENCYWGTDAEQSRNTSRTRLITWNGKTQCAADWALELGWNAHSLTSRLRRGWSVEQTMTTPVQIRTTSVATGL